MTPRARPTRRRFLEAVAAGMGTLALVDFQRAEAAVVRGLDLISDKKRHRPGDLEAEYLLDPGISFLNHASIGTTPRVVHEARVEYARICETNPWLYMWGGAWEEARESVRARAAELLGVATNQLAITHNTTEGFNLLARGLPLGDGDEVLFTNLNHPGASIAWERFAPERGYSVREAEIPLDRSGEMTVTDLLEAHDRAIRPETRVLVVPHLDNVVGFRHPLEALVRLARSRGVEFVAVDGAQSAGMFPLELEETGIDFYSTSTHKWVQSPKGLGLFYVREGLLDSLTPMWVTWGQARWEGSARVFEDYGTRNLPELLALGDALDLQSALGARWKLGRYESLRNHLRQSVLSTPELVWRSPSDPDFGGPLVAIERAGVDVGPLGRWLWQEHRTVVRAFPGDRMNTIRVSPNTFTSEDDLDRLIDLLRRYPS